MGPNDDLLWVEANFLATKRFVEGVICYWGQFYLRLMRTFGDIVSNETRYPRMGQKGMTLNWWGRTFW